MTQEIESYRVTTVALNVRATPSPTSDILGHAIKDQVVEKIEETPDGAWIKHKVNSMVGWSTKKYLSKITSEVLAGDFPWMPIAEKEYGIIEFPGDEHNPRILEYFGTVKNIGSRWKVQDETPWCSAFVNWCVEEAGYIGTKSALSMSWLNWGKEINEPVKGCIAIFSRNGGGHVGFYIDETTVASETFIRILGGNQDQAETDIGAVNLKFYPKSKLLGYRVP
jgi:uncharacterized protein (TIGR02594 family)